MSSLSEMTFFWIVFLLQSWEPASTLERRETHRTRRWRRNGAGQAAPLYAKKQAVVIHHMHARGFSIATNDISVPSPLSLDASEMGGEGE
ncbi:hypothetical protein V5799_007092 [Amblyomma americanum]|uniref:Secreted protein n=1 Tax=Amblyomma americanum TaxID=6943 RepID=A0AAQ4DUI7_AMBAM